MKTAPDSTTPAPDTPSPVRVAPPTPPPFDESVATQLARPLRHARSGQTIFYAHAGWLFTAGYQPIAPATDAELAAIAALPEQVKAAQVAEEKSRLAARAQAQATVAAALAQHG